MPLGQVGAVGGDQGIVALGQAADEGIGVGDAGGPLDFLAGGVQLAEADVVGDGAGKQMGVLEHHAQRPAQGVLFDLPDVDAVVGHRALLHVVKAVDQVGDGGFSGAGRAYKGDLLPRFGKEADLLEDGVVRVVAEGHAIKAHIPPQRHPGTVSLLPSPAAVRVPHQVHGAFILLGQLVHDGEHPLGSGQCRQQEVALLGELVDGHGGLTHKHQVAGKAAHVGKPLHGHITAQRRHDGVVDVGDAHHRRDHGSGVSLGAGTSLAQGFVFLLEAAQVFPFVVKDLDHLLTGGHLLDVAVQVAQMGLLLSVVAFAAAGAVPDV